MSASPIVIFGAGATKACGGPLTNEILPLAFSYRDRRVAREIFDREGFLSDVEAFLADNFHLHRSARRGRRPRSRRPQDFPPLPLLLSLVDTALDRKHAFGERWDPRRLTDVRDGLEYTIFALLEYQLRNRRHDSYLRLLELVWPAASDTPATVSLNYDIILDNALMSRSERLFQGRARFPDYGCDIATSFYRDRPERYGRLLKLHGSLNWLYCPSCHRLELGMSESGRRTVKVLNELWGQHPGHRLEQRYSCKGSPCADPSCGALVRPVLITPTHQKDYRNPHIAQVWYRAEQMLRRCDRAIIIGYSLPEDDVDVVYLLKRGLGHLRPEAISVIERDGEHRAVGEHPVGNRYRSLFGERIDWRTEGLDAWIDGYRRRRRSPLASLLPSSRRIAREFRPRTANRDVGANRAVLARPKAARTTKRPIRPNVPLDS